MMGLLWVTFILLATQVTCSLAVSCDLPSSLNSTKASELLRNYNDAGSNISSSGVTVLKLIEFALNTTGNITLTKSKLNWSDTCFDHFTFTLRQVALINGKELDQFPGNASMNYIRMLVTSNATKAVVQDVNQTLNTFRDRNVTLDRNLDSFIKEVGFIVKKASFISILSYSLKSGNYSSTAALLGYDQRLINATLPQAAEYLLLTEEELKVKFTLEFVVRHLRSAKTFTRELLDYIMKERETEKTVASLVSTEDANILTVFKTIYQGNNLIFMQFYGEQKVELKYLDYTIAEISMVTQFQSTIIKNYTIEKLFNFLYGHAELLLVYKAGVQASKTMRVRILTHYQIASESVLKNQFNLTLSQLGQLTDVGYENYAIRYYIYRYAMVHLNKNFGELEAFAKLQPGSLKNATVNDFPQLMSQIGVAYAVKALNESTYLKWLLDNHTALEIHMKPLKEQIEKDRQPLTTSSKVLYVDFEISYIVHLRRLNTAVFYERSVFNFTETLHLDWNSFFLLFKLNSNETRVIKRLFIQYSFKDISRFFGIKMYTIFTWKFEVIITRLLRLHLYEIDECALGRHNSCPVLSTCDNYIGGYECICRPGYNVDPDNYCRDVDECKLQEYIPMNVVCPYNGSRCENSYGSFNCVCPDGYKIDSEAVLCVDINECLVGNPCINIAHSECVNKHGSYECRCLSGFNATYNETVSPKVLLNCTDIDECKGKPCNNVNNSECVNIDGSYECRCKSGYNATYDETVSPKVLLNCTANDRCIRPELNRCDRNANCSNTIGGYKCTCMKGYEGNGYFCQDKDECSSIFNKCFPNARCRNLPGTYECYCNPGFEFNERLNYCRDKNECLPPNANPCSNVTHSQCVNKRGSYECRCLSGYNATYDETVSPKVLLNCTDIDECSRPELNRCHKNAHCSNTNGGYNCTCKKGYIGNGYSCKENRVINPILLRLIFITRTTRIRPFLGFYYGGKVHSKIYISTNGLISIGKRYERSSPKSCENRRLKKDILAPFWASSAGGQVGYQQFAKEEDNARPVLERINEIVDQTTNLTGFEANWALVVAWKDIIPKYCSWFCWFLGNPYRDETNTFQAILATNGSTSVVMFLYDDNGMNWYRRLGRKAMVGYATKSGSCKEYQGSFTESIFDIDDQSFTDLAGRSRRGVIVIVFSKGNVPPTPEERCLSWIRNQPKDNEWMEDIPSCPCTLRAARSDSRFEYWSRTSQRICYAYIKNEYTKTCCYFRRGFWTSGALITSARLAGRVARYSPVSKRADYEEHDEKPFKQCCIDSTKYCDDFSQYRPVENSCSNQEPRPCSCQWNFGWRWTWRIVIRRRRRRVRRWWQRAPRRGWFFGDPHITTLDGFKYSFNGLGDYVLLSTSDKSHTLHGKTIRPPYKDTNKLSNATVFSGFAMRNKKNTTVQVLFSDTTPGNLSILVKNSTNFCQPPFGITDLKSAPGFVLKKSNDTVIVMFEDSGFSVEITPGIGLLQISFSVPPELADKNTTGLLGKLNGDKTDDLTYPNGSVLSTSSTDKKIFAYGQTWKVQDGEELFEYDNCSKMPVFYDGNFRPTFLSDFDNSTSNYQNISRQCGGNEQCILDILLTGNEALGLATLKFDKENDEKRAAMDNQPPDITVTPEVINVTVNETVTVSVNVSDPNDGDTVTLSDTGNLPTGATFNNITGIFSWTPSSNQKNEDFKIEFAARDQQDAAQVKSVAVKFCDCKYGQECDFTNILRSNTNNSFELVGCNCSEGYSGDHCETKNDPCADDPCYGNVTCTPNAAPAAYGYTCGSCPDGLVGNGEDCNDFDECLNPANNTCKVNESCINTVGSYRCQCKPGYKVQTPGGNCTDVDECNPVFSNDCGANTVCTNTLGSHNCTCKEGYEGNPKQGCTDVDECQQDGRCNHNCQNTPGSFNCTCYSGYKLTETSPGNYTCEDINECKYLINNDCDQICQNVPSSYLCSCRDGYVLDANNKTCSVNNSCSSGHGCDHECIVSGQNQCQCNKGYELLADNKTCQDINECSRDLDGCAHNCTNVNGSYSCSCLPGYKLMANKRDCKEIDECKKDNGGCEHKCTNTPGSRRCSCKRGYELADDKMKCKDIDECKTAGQCKYGQNCKNKKGGYKCRCPPGRFTDGTFGCRRSKRFRFRIRLLKYLTNLVWNDDLNDEFSDYYISFSRVVVIEINTYFKTKSRFRKGYMGCRVNGFKRGSIIANVSLNFDPNSNATIAGLQQDVNSNTAMGGLSYDPQQSSVSDVNECNDPEENDCHGHATCVNTDGSYTCTCKDGYSGDGVNCAKVIDNDNTALIIGLSIGLSLLVIIIIIIILICCYRRNQKGRLPVTEEQHGMRPMRITKRPESGEVYYGDNKGRRGSNDSFEGRYDVARATNYYDNPGMKKDESFEDQYDVAMAPDHDYENPGIKKDPENLM